MIRVLIVDDDYLARMYLRQLIDWEAEGCTVVGDAANGQEALERLEALEPQLILTDISMPVMDGVELIARLKERGCAARIAVLSCHDEFQYVKEAMRLGADEYVLKNTLDADGLRALLGALRQGLAQGAQEARERERLAALAERGSRAVLRDMLRALREAPLPFEEQRALLARSGLALECYQCAALLLAWGPDAPAAAVRGACAQFAEGKGAALIEDGETRLAALLDLTGLHSRQEQRDALAAFAAGLAHAVRTGAGRTLLTASSAPCEGDGGLTRALRQAGEAAGGWFYGRALCIADELPAWLEALPAPCAQALDEARRPGGSGGAFEECFRAALDALAAAPAQPARVTEWIARLDEACGVQADAPRTLADCRARLAPYREALTARAQDARLQAVNPAVAQASAYIRAHFAEPISLAQVAEAVGLNPAYLSFVFKRDSGVNFSDYLLSCRMEAVRRRLRETAQPIKDVAAGAGFVDYRHFCKLFKKETGLRPADYRKQAGAE